jgi:hypothetical protein
MEGTSEGVRSRQVPYTGISGSGASKGLFQAMWVAGLERYDEAQGIKWSWLSADGCMTKAPLALEAVGENPTDRGKKREQTPYARR